MRKLIGQTFDGYEVKEDIATNGRIENYRAFHPRLSRRGQFKAVRIWDIHLQNDEWVTTTDITTHFHRQTEIIQSLRHRHFAPIYGYGQKEEWLYLITDESSGYNLASQMIPGKPFPWQRATTIIVPIAQTLATIHEHRVTYAEIKPVNILLPQADRATLAIDFLLLSLPDPAASLMSRAISLEAAAQMTYAAPEQIQEVPPNPKTDIYSLGILLYQLLSGQFPYHGDTALDFLMARLSTPPQPLQKTSPQAPAVFAPILEKALALNPNDRYQTMADFAQTLIDAEASLTSPAGAAPPAVRPPMSDRVKTAIRGSGTATKPNLFLKLKQHKQTFPLASQQTELLVGRASKKGTAPKPNIDLGPYGGHQNGVSRLHGRLSRRGDQWSIEDLGSTNGTFLNGSRLPPHQKIPIREGDKVAFGQLELELCSE